ncbi:MAG TPA: TIGR03885 family FMN-dependent LLM class oxidoreductase [Alphaproteobacteria bacterium]|nr:TIGR03885 family FMN-dependent LLM class oxidoreductase [Alphaproteobacteria bacterium]
MLIGYHASHEQFTPRQLLDWTVMAERAGFTAFMSSDHFHPWSEAQGQSGYAWSWLGAAFQAGGLPGGVISAPGWRYHPAIIAQAGATLEQMFPGRFWLALGSGEALSDHIVGGEWPPKPERNERLRESAEIIRRLWAGETVTHRGRITVVEAKLYTRPAAPPPLFGAAVTEKTAEWLGGWADGLLTTASEPEKLQPVIDAFRRGGGTGKPVKIQVALSWAEREEEALRLAWEQWRWNALGGDVNWELPTPQHFETAAKFIRPEDVRSSVLVSPDLDYFVEVLKAYKAMGVEAVYLHQVGLNQEPFLKVFGERVLGRV